MPYYISEDDIHEYFQECGTIAELDCMMFPDTGKFKGIAFITFRVNSRNMLLHGESCYVMGFLWFPGYRGGSPAVLLFSCTLGFSEACK